MNWRADIFRRRFAAVTEATLDAFADIVNMVSAANFQDFPFCLTSKASQVDVSAWGFLYSSESDSVCSLYEEFLTCVQTSPLSTRVSLASNCVSRPCCSHFFYCRPYEKSPLCDRSFLHNSSDNGRWFVYLTRFTIVTNCVSKKYERNRRSAAWSSHEWFRLLWGKNLWDCGIF